MCELCQNKGFVEDMYHRDGFVRTIVRQCRNRCNIAGYSTRVQQAMSQKDGPETAQTSQPRQRVTMRRKPCEVIPFKRG